MYVALEEEYSKLQTLVTRRHAKRASYSKDVGFHIND
jgi:hypothetical protein